MVDEEPANIEFWSGKVVKGQTLHMSTSTPEDILHLKMACFGEEVNTGSRTVLYCDSNKQKVALCVLRENALENQPLNLCFPGGRTISFSIRGTNPSPVNLSGYIQPLIDLPEEEEEETETKVGMKRPAPEVSQEDERPKKKMKEEPKVKKPVATTEKMEVEEKKPKTPEKEIPVSKPKEETLKIKAPTPPAAVEQKVPKPAAVISQQPSAVLVEDPPIVVAPATPKESPKPAPKPVAKTKTPEKTLTKAEKKRLKKRKKFKFENNGLGVRVTKPGSGRAAQKGDTITVRYIGQLENENIFDKNLQTGLTVSLGEGDVIKGWELGCMGMTKGEKRKLIIPSDLAYGAEGGDQIPPNAELWFTMECVELLEG